jgi:hypothetical protein
VFRHTVFFIFRDDITPEKVLHMQKGLAYMRFECKGVQAIDYGTDLFGGSDVRRKIKPFKRSPRWKGAVTGPPCNYDIGLMLDFKNAAGNDAYNNDDVHHEVGDYNASICDPELSARVDWTYPGNEFLFTPGHVRHSAMFLWRDDATARDKKDAEEAVSKLGDVKGVESFTLGKNIGKLKTDFDWIMDVQVRDKAAANVLLKSKAYKDAMKAVAPVTKYEWTARLTHVMRGI